MNENPNPCVHAIGTAESDFHEVIVLVGDKLREWNNFAGWRFCPYCGKNIASEVAAMKQSIAENTAAWKKDRDALEARRKAQRSQAASRALASSSASQAKG